MNKSDDGEQTTLTFTASNTGERKRVKYRWGLSPLVREDFAFSVGDSAEGKDRVVLTVTGITSPSPGLTVGNHFNCVFLLYPTNDVMDFLCGGRNEDEFPRADPQFEPMMPEMRFKRQE